MMWILQRKVWMSPLERDFPWKKLNFNQKRLELKNHNSKLKSNHSNRK